jgi:hypothetical protein
MKEKLKNLIEETFGKLETMDELDRSRFFNIIFHQLVEIMERDFNYSLQIIEKKNVIHR